MINKNMFYKSKLFISIFIIFFILGEAFLRLMGWKDNQALVYYSSEPDIGWLPTPNYEGRHWYEPELIKFNSQGLRDYEYTFEKPKGTFRIFIVGECTVFGSGISVPEKFAKQLEVMLNDKPIFKDFKRYEVISAGFVQWDDLQKVAYADRYGLRYNPDLIILSHDVGTKKWFDVRRELEWYRKIEHIIPKSSYFMRYLYRMTGNCLTVWLDFESNRKLKSMGVIQYISRLYNENSIYRVKTEKALERLTQLSKDKRMPVMVVFFPWLDYLGERPYPFKKIGEFYKNACLQHDIPFLNLTEYFLNKKADLFLTGNKESEERRPNRLAHQIIAKKIYDFLKSDNSNFLNAYNNGKVTYDKR